MEVRALWVALCVCVLGGWGFADCWTNLHFCIWDNGCHLQTREFVLNMEKCKAIRSEENALDGHMNLVTLLHICNSLALNSSCQGWMLRNFNCDEFERWTPGTAVHLMYKWRQKLEKEIEAQFWWNFLLMISFEYEDAGKQLVLTINCCAQQKQKQIINNVM